MMTDHAADRDEDMLRRVLREEADAVHPRPNWDDVRDRAHGRRRRRWIPAAAAVIALLVVTAGLAVLVSDDGQTGVVADGPAQPDPNADPPLTTAPQLTTTVPPSTTSTSIVAAVEEGPEVGPLDLPSGAPLGDDEMVASITIPTQEIPAVEIVVLSTSSGEVKRSLADGYDTVEGGVYGFALSPDRRTALYVVSTAACTSRIEAVAVDGSSEPQPVTDDGSDMAFSPDGSMLAIAPGDTCNSPPSLTVVPTEGGPSTRYIGVAPEDDGIESMAFTDDGALLFASGPRTTEPTFRLRRLDLGSGTAIELTPGPEFTNYTSLDRHEGAVTALEQQFRGQPSLVTLEDGQVTDRRAVQITGDLSGGRVGYDHSGAVITARSGDYRLSIDGRVIREDVLDVAL